MARKKPVVKKLKRESPNDIKSKAKMLPYGGEPLKNRGDIIKNKNRVEKAKNPYKIPIEGRPRVSSKVGKAMDAVSKFSKKKSL